MKLRQALIVAFIAVGVAVGPDALGRVAPGTAPDVLAQDRPPPLRRRWVVSTIPHVETNLALVHATSPDAAQATQPEEVR